jgi:prepilin-type N-terminal cleavage/methylation domain-containing protein
MAERRGFTLVEIMMALAITLVVAGALHSLLLSTQRLTWAQSERISLQSSLRAGSLVVLNELRELSTLGGGTASQNDVLRIAPGSVMYRAMRGTGFICQTPAAGTLRLDRARFTGHRDPQAGRDSVYVFVPGDSTGSVPRSWLALPILAVTSGGACAGGSGPGITLTVPAGAVLTSLEVGTPVRVAEIMELRLYQADRKSWLGARSVSAGETIQPVVGPLAPGRGFRLDYLGGAGTPTADPAHIKSVRITLLAEPQDRGEMTRRLGILEEQLVSQVTLRNALTQ